MAPSHAATRELTVAARKAAELSLSVSRLTEG
jgi:hypothetical protein